MQIFVDMDGVLADFDSGYRKAFGVYGGKEADDADWEKVRAMPSFYAGLLPMPDFDVLWGGLAPYRPIILTGIHSSAPEALDNKRAWVIKYIGSDVQVIGCKSREKCKYGEIGDVLIDDWEKYQHLWLAMGGYWITHISATQSLDLLHKYLNGC